MAERTPELRVRFSKRRDPGVLWGRTISQLLWLGLAGALALIAFKKGIWWLAVPAATAGVLGFARLYGRAAADVLPAAAADALLRVTGLGEYRSGPYRHPADGCRPAGWRLPGPLSRLEVRGYRVGAPGGEVGVVFDRADGTTTCVLKVAGPNFLLEGAEQAGIYTAAFGRLLDGLAREDSPIVAIQSLSRVRPDVADDAWRALSEHGGRGSRFAQRINEELLDAMSGSGLAHESYLSVRIDPAKSRSLLRQFGGGDDGAAALAFHTVAGLSSSLTQAGVTVDGWLPPRAVAGLVRSAFDPAADAMLARRGGGAGDTAGGDTGLASGCSPVAAEPIRLARARSYVAHNDCYSRTWWATEFPHADDGVPVGFLAPLVLSLPVRHTVSIILQPVARRAAARAVEEHTSTADAKAQMNVKAHRRIRRSDAQEGADVARREAELVEGFATYRMALLVSVTAPSLAELAAASAQAESAMNTALLEAQVWYTETDQAFFAAALPLARGLK